MNKKIIAAVIGGFSLLASGTASADIIGGVEFGTPPTPTIETTTLAETLITGDGQTLTGYGQVNTVNGEINYAGANRLYFVFTDYVSANFSTSSADFTGGTAQFFLGSSATMGNLLAESSAKNINDITTLLGTPWLTVKGADIGTGYTLHANGTLIGINIGFTGAGLLSVTGGLADVVALFDNNLLGGGADMSLTTDGANVTLNSHDNLTGCSNGTAVNGQYCVSGSLTAQSPEATHVPEPGVIALIGLGLLGFGASQRKNKFA